MNLICAAMRAAQAQAMAEGEAGLRFDEERNIVRPTRGDTPAPINLNDVNTTGVMLTGVEGLSGESNAVRFDRSGVPADVEGRPYGPDATVAVRGGGQTIRRTMSECLEIIR